MFDIVPPGRDGLSLRVEAKRMSPDTEVVIMRAHPGLPVVLPTGWAAEWEDREALEAGVANILAKPCAISELLATVGATTGSGVVDPTRRRDEESSKS